MDILCYGTRQRQLIQLVSAIMSRESINHPEHGRLAQLVYRAPCLDNAEVVGSTPMLATDIVLWGFWGLSPACFPRYIGTCSNGVEFHDKVLHKFVKMYFPKHDVTWPVCPITCFCLQLLCHWKQNPFFSGSGGIRTHASEETGA